MKSYWNWLETEIRECEQLEPLKTWFAVINWTEILSEIVQASIAVPL